MSVRASFVACAVVVGTVFVVGLQADHTLPPDESFDVVNPCTGLPATVFFHYVKFVYHENLDATGGGHFTSTAVLEVTSTDGFSGSETFWIGGNFGPGHSGIEEQTSTFTDSLGNGSGQRVLVHGVMHIVFKNGVAVVEHESFSAECVGKPVA